VKLHSAVDQQAIVAQASSPAGFGGVTPPVCGWRTGTVLEPAVGDDCATVGGFHAVLIQTAQFARGMTWSNPVKAGQTQSRLVKPK